METRNETGSVNGVEYFEVVQSVDRKTNEDIVVRTNLETRSLDKQAAHNPVAWHAAIS